MNSISYLKTIVIPGKQTGATLILALIILLLLTILSLSSVRSTVIKEKIFRNNQDVAMALEAAEAGLRTSEIWLAGLNNEPIAHNYPGCTAVPPLTCEVFDRDLLPNLGTQAHAWWTTNGRNYNTVTGDDILPSLTETQPHFVMEQQAFIPDSLVRGFDPSKGKHVFRTTSRGTGRSNNSQAIVQDSFIKRFMLN